MPGPVSDSYNHNGLPVDVEDLRDIAGDYGLDLAVLVARDRYGAVCVVTWGEGDTADAPAKHLAAEIADHLKVSAEAVGLFGVPLLPPGTSATATR